MASESGDGVGGRHLLLTAISIVSAVGLAYEVALIRVFSIAQWHHFAYMIISMALLGFAASGVLLGALRKRIAGREPSLFRWCVLLLPPSLIGCYAASQAIPFETLQLVARPRQFGYLFGLYLVLTVPFFFVSSCIALGFMLRPREVGRVYWASLAGSGLGAAAVVALLFVLPATWVPNVLAAVALMAAFCVCAGQRGWRTAVGLVSLGIAGLVAWRGATPVRMSEYKDLSYALRLPDARIVAEREGPVSRVTAVASRFLRETPGQVSGYPMAELGEFPRQVGLYFDGGGASPVHLFDGALEPFAFLDHVTSALPYHLVREPRVLVIGAGGGTDVLSALYHGASMVTALELDPTVHALVRDELREWSGGLFDRPDVDLVLAEGRGFLESRRGARFDVIHIALLDSFGAAAAGVHALSESYLYTTEAISLYLERLSEDGLLAVTRWLKSPPRDAIKLFATMFEGGREAGLVDPAAHLAFIRSWNTATVIASRSPLSAERIATIRAFAETRGFDRSYHPGLDASEVNRFTVLEEPTYFLAAQAIIAGRGEELFRRYPFHVRPATDDSPYYFRFVRLRSLPELMRRAGRDWVHFVEWGYLVLVATVAQAALAALLLVLLPLFLLARGAVSASVRSGLAAYFSALGLAFMCLEIAFIQKLMRFLHHPLYAVAVVLAAFLLFSAWGSLFAGRHRGSPLRMVAAVVGALAALCALYLLALPSLFATLSAWPDAARVSIALVVLAPLAFLMGIPFPTGLQALADRGEALLPWAWGVNGAASVVGAPLATLLAVHAGFRAVVGLSLVLYLSAALTLRGLVRE